MLRQSIHYMKDNENVDISLHNGPILSHVNCFIPGKVAIGFQVLLDSLHPRSTTTSRWSPPG